MKKEYFSSCIDACNKCVIACNHCIVSCLNEKDVGHLAKCIQLNIECAAFCKAAIELMTFESIYSKQICKLCSEICGDCATECEQHDMKQCMECAEACRKCEKACLDMSKSMIFQ